MPHWPQAAGQFCDPLDICSRELVEDSLVFPERYLDNKEKARGQVLPELF